jgi:hypothetical protein
VGQSAGGLGVDGVALLAHKHHDGHRDRGQRLVIGQEALVAPELDPEEGLRHQDSRSDRGGGRGTPPTSGRNQHRSRQPMTTSTEGTGNDYHVTAMARTMTGTATRPPNRNIC